MISKEFGKLTMDSEHSFTVQIWVSSVRSAAKYYLETKPINLSVPDKFSSLIHNYKIPLNNDDIQFLWEKFSSNRFVSPKVSQVTDEIIRLSRELLMPALAGCQRE